MYITDSELQVMFPQAADFSSEQRENAINQSGNMVMAYIRTELHPIVQANLETGNFPYILKMAQLQFARYVLEFSNVGYTEELDNLYKSTADICAKITKNELNIPGESHNSKDLGWQIVNVTVADSSAFAEARGGVPQVYQSWELEFISSTHFKVTRDDGSILAASQQIFYNWYNILYGSELDAPAPVDASLEMRFTGTWTVGDKIKIVGVPYEHINTPESSDGISSGRIIYF